MGPPRFFDVSLPACHGLRTPAALPILAKSDALVLPAVCMKTLGVRNKPFRSGTSTAGCAVTPAAYRILCLRLVHLVRHVRTHDSAMDTRLDTGGWLTLTRQGLLPCKRRQAFLDAITPTPQPLPTAGATLERTVEAVGWTPWLDAPRATVEPFEPSTVMISVGVIAIPINEVILYKYLLFQSHSQITKKN
jgi:hypothetical protein